MNGKIIGAIAGFWLGGPFGAIIGATMGHFFADQKEQGITREEVIEFLVRSIAKVASADGRISDEEIANVETLFRELKVSGEERIKLIHIFRDAKNDSSTLIDILKNHMQRNRRFTMDTNSKVNYIRLLVEVAMCDGNFSPKEEALLREVSAHLSLLQYFEANFTNNNRYNSSSSSYSNSSNNSNSSTGMSRNEAFVVLGINANATKEEIKKAFRQKSKELHPDTLHSKNLPASVIKLAEAEFMKVKQAYDTLSK